MRLSLNSIIWRLGVRPLVIWSRVIYIRPDVYQPLAQGALVVKRIVVVCCLFVVGCFVVDMWLVLCYGVAIRPAAAARRAVSSKK